MRVTHLLGDILAQARAFPGILWKAEASWKGVTLGEGVTFIGRPMISVAEDSRLTLGNRVSICSAVRSNRLGCFQPSVLRTLAPRAELCLGNGVGISGTVVCAGKQIVIGENTIMGSGAMLYDNDGHIPGPDGTWPTDFVKSARPIIIGNGVFIGARAIIMKGVRIGDGAVIGIGSVVTRNVAPYSIYFGNPAREIGVRTDPFAKPMI